MLPLAERVVEAYGGADRLKAATSVQATVNARGFAFFAKMRGGIRDMRVEASLQESQVVSWSKARPDLRRRFDGRTVEIEDGVGNIITARHEPRKRFPYGRRLFYWDRLDEIYFSSYALWNYLTLPALLMRDDIEWSDPGETTLEARFPPELPTHCPVQQLHFDRDTALLRQHDYTANVFGGWAKAANVVLAHGVSDGVPYPSHRRVTPRKSDGTPRAFPLLVDIRIHDWRLV